MNTSSDRAQVVQLGALMHPGACALCGNGTCVDGYLDTGVYYEYEGIVYFCMRCIEQFCTVVGALLPDEVNSMKEQTEQIAKRCAELEEENNDLTNRVAAWDSVLSGAGISGISSGNVEPSEQDEPASDPEPVTGSEAGKPITKKPTTKRRRNDASQPSAGNSNEFII